MNIACIYLQPVLLGIMRGEVYSAQHKIYTHGSKKEQRQLKLGNKCGPIKEWCPSQVFFSNDIICYYEDLH